MAQRPAKQPTAIPPVPPPAGCSRHREEMTLLALQKKLAAKNLPPAERAKINTEIERIEAVLGLS